MGLYGFNPQDVFSFLLALMRISLVVFTLPFFGGKGAPAPVKTALCLVLTLALWPSLNLDGRLLPASLWEMAIMFLGEVTLGLILALLINVMFAAVQTGGSIIGFQMGFAMINIADPLTGESKTATAHFLYMLSFLTFLSIGGHLFMLKGFTASFDHIPPGGLYLSTALAERVMDYTGQIFVLAVKVASPVMAAIFLVDLALGLIGRAAPQMHILVFGFPVKNVVGFLCLWLMFAVLSDYVQGFVGQIEAMFTTVYTLGR